MSAQVLLQLVQHLLINATSTPTHLGGPAISWPAKKCLCFCPFLGARSPVASGFSLLLLRLLCVCGGCGRNKFAALPLALELSEADTEGLDDRMWCKLLPGNSPPSNKR